MHLTPPSRAIRAKLDTLFASMPTGAEAASAERWVSWARALDPSSRLVLLRHGPLLTDRWMDPVLGGDDDEAAAEARERAVAVFGALMVRTAQAVTPELCLAVEGCPSLASIPPQRLWHTVGVSGVPDLEAPASGGTSIELYAYAVGPDCDVPEEGVPDERHGDPPRVARAAGASGSSSPGEGEVEGDDSGLRPTCVFPAWAVNTALEAEPLPVVTPAAWHLWLGRWAATIFQPAATQMAQRETPLTLDELRWCDRVAAFQQSVRAGEVSHVADQRVVRAYQRITTGSMLPRTTRGNRRVPAGLPLGLAPRPGERRVTTRAGQEIPRLVGAAVALPLNHIPAAWDASSAEWYPVLCDLIATAPLTTRTPVASGRCGTGVAPLPLLSTVLQPQTGPAVLTRLAPLPPEAEAQLQELNGWGAMSEAELAWRRGDFAQVGAIFVDYAHRAQAASRQHRPEQAVQLRQNADIERGRLLRMLPSWSATLARTGRLGHSERAALLSFLTDRLAPSGPMMRLMAGEWIGASLAALAAHGEGDLALSWLLHPTRAVAPDASSDAAVRTGGAAAGVAGPVVPARQTTTSDGPPAVDADVLSQLRRTYLERVPLRLSRSVATPLLHDPDQAVRLLVLRHLLQASEPTATVTMPATRQG